MPKVVISGHAREQMEERGITEEKSLIWLLLFI